jgi:hypothetical protein
MKTILVFPVHLALETPKSFFLKAHLRWAFKKNDLYETDFVLLASTILKEQNLSHIELLVTNIIYPLK